MEQNLKPRTYKTDEYTIKSGWLDVGDGHQVWYEQWGNPEAETPILMFHGGPGGEHKPKHKYDFDPTRHQVIGFDQRGGGNSLPYGEIKNNTTLDLTNDAVKILEHLNVDKVHVNSGSWGSTLALLFAVSFPERIKSVVVRGVFSGTQQEIDWLDKGLFRRHYPEVWERFVASVPEKYKDNPAQYHYQIIEKGTQAELEATSKALSDLEYPTLIFDWRGFDPDINKDSDPEKPQDAFDPVPYKIYGHYFKNACFLEPDYILQNAHKIKVPLYIVQGRYDMACPPTTAYNLHKAVKGSKLYITLSSHSTDPETNTALKIIRDQLY